MVSVVKAHEVRRVLDGLFALPALRLALWVTIFAALFPGVFTDPEKILAFMDEHQFMNWEEADRLSIARFGQLPLWNPYYCGGMVSAAAPESGVFSPDFVLRLAFGVISGRRLALTLFIVLGMEGMYRLNREVRGSALSGVFAATVGATFTTLVTHYLGMGWVNFLGFELVPWVVLGLVKGRESVGWRFVGAMALGWIALAAGTYTAPYTGIAVGFIALALCATSLVPFRGRELRATLASAGTVLAGGGLLAIAKLVPMVLVMRRYPRVFTPVEAHEPMQLLSGYWPVYSVVLVLAVIALFFRDRWARIFFATAVLFFVLAMGQFAEWAPTSIMRKLPLVSGLRYPERYMVMFHTFATLTAARGVSHLEDLVTKGLTGVWGAIRGPARRTPLEALLVPIVCGVVSAAVLFQVGRPIAASMLGASAIAPHALYTFDPPRRVEQEFKQARGNRRDAHVWPYANRGTLYCFVGIPLPESAKLRADLQQEEYPADPTVAKVERLSWSPHTIKLHVEASAPTRIFVNQNWNEHWSSDVGHVVNDAWLLGVDVPEGSYDLTLRYRDWTSVACVLLSLAALAGMLSYIGKHGYARAREWFSAYKQLIALSSPAPAPAAPASTVDRTPGGDDANEDPKRREEES